MTQLTFTYGPMASGKTIEILKVAHNYESAGRKVLLFTSKLDNRTKIGEISSRIGLHRDAIAIDDNFNVFDYVERHCCDCVLVDEAQFLSKHHVVELTRIVDQLDIPVMTYGLKTDFQNNLFEGTKYLFAFADHISEMKTICHFCAHKATMNLRYSNSRPVYSGNQVQIGGDESYIPVCRKHYYNPPKRK